MRYIDLAKLRMPDGWLKEAQEEADKVTSGADPEDGRETWKKLKSAMSRLSDTKCWYCESPNDRDDNAVDHFRPKKRVSDAARPHGGYRWLAFEPTNFRFACTFCNSRRIDVDFGTAGGKADRFPLIDEDKRVYVKGSIASEEPSLLDPCNWEDCELLGCQQENGRPCATNDDPGDIDRVNISIEVYHLDRDATCMRRHGIAVTLIADLMSAKEAFEAYRQGNIPKPKFLEAAAKVRRAIGHDAPYSGEMKFLVRGQRSPSHPWIQKILEAG